MTSYLVMLQTNSNQPFIFSSPRLREQIGASFEITLLSKWVKDKAEELLDTKTLPSSFWVSDSSGKVIIRFTDGQGDPEKLAKRLIREVTLRALTDAPGLDVTGVFVKGSSSTVDADDRGGCWVLLGCSPASRRRGGGALPSGPVPGTRIRVCFTRITETLRRRLQGDASLRKRNTQRSPSHRRRHQFFTTYADGPGREGILVPPIACETRVSDDITRTAS